MSTSSPTHHYSAAGTLAACGQLADGTTHTTWSAEVLRKVARPRNGMTQIGRVDICRTCLAVAGGRREVAAR